VERDLNDDRDLGAGGMYRWEVRVLAAARELRAHGDSVSAARILNATLTRLGPAPSPPAPGAHADWGPSTTGDTAVSAWVLRGALLYEAGRWAEARHVFAAFAADTDDSFVLGRLGTIAARTGDRVGAERFAARLAALQRPYLQGQHTGWRAHIAAVLGDSATAVSLLRTALREGRPVIFPEAVAMVGNIHTDPDLATLRGYPPFQALATPAR
jgi:hypothetical protein